MPRLIRTLGEASGGMRIGTGPAVVALIIMLDLVLEARTRLSFSGWRLPLGCVLLLVLVSVAYRTVRHSPALAEFALFAAFWIAFSIAGAINTYLAATAARPLWDPTFASLDAQLGFDWLGWTLFVHAHSTLYLAFSLAYGSLMPQVVASLLVFASVPASGRNNELLAAAAVALLLTSLISAVMPALGPWISYLGRAANQQDLAILADMHALRSGHPPVFALGRMQGIVSSPSYHTILAVLFIHAHRGCKSWLPMCALNTVMLASIPSEGGHYVVDMIAGVFVAVLALGVVRALRPQAAGAAGPGVPARQHA